MASMDLPLAQTSADSIPAAFARELSLYSAPALDFGFNFFQNGIARFGESWSLALAESRKAISKVSFRPKSRQALESHGRIG
jgi:hypothetical protein